MDSGTYTVLEWQKRGEQRLEDADDTFVDRIAVLRKNVSDTLTFLHQERNDFLPEEDVIIPSRKDDHISKEIDLGSINLKTPKRSTSDYDDTVIIKEGLDAIIEPYIECVRTQKSIDDKFRAVAEEEVTGVIKEAETVVNDKISSTPKSIRFQDEIFYSTKETADSLFEDLKTTTEDSLNNLESLKDDSISAAQEKSEEAFKFLENEASSPCISDSASFIQREVDSTFTADSSTTIPVSPKSPRSSIPVAKTRKSLEKEKDVDVFLNEDVCVSPTDSELLSRIPVAMKAGKVKTIKKHSKDPLKEFVALSKDVNWDDDEETTKIIRTVTSDPIVKTTVTRITSDNLPDNVKSKIPVLHTEALSPLEVAERYSVEASPSPKSKIPVLKTETTRIVSPEHAVESVVSPGSRVSTKSIDSDSDEDSRRSPPLKGILKKTVRTIGSSSGSDVALHEEGAELSDDDSASKNPKPLETRHVLYPLVWSFVALATSMIVLALLAQY